MANHYKTLRVKKKATQEEIKDAYRNLAREYHPDKKNGNAKKFKELASAYEILSDPERRKFYDRTGSSTSANEIISQASGLLQQLFQIVVGQKGLVRVQAIDMIAEINSQLDSGFIELDKNIDVARKSRKEIGKVLKKVKHENTMNPISLMLKQEIAKHSTTIEKSKHNIMVGKKARELWNEYGYDFDLETAPVYSGIGYGVNIMKTTVTFSGT